MKRWIDLVTAPEIRFPGSEEELYGFVVEHFLRICLIEGLQQFKSVIPKKKKQAIRTKITALSERETAPKKKSKTTHKSEEAESYTCPKCIHVLLENPLGPEENSIVCGA